MGDIKTLTHEVKSINIVTLEENGKKIYSIGKTQWQDKSEIFSEGVMFSETKIVETSEDFIKLLTITEKPDIDSGRIIVVNSVVTYISLDIITSINVDLKV
jgi:hypothetical protein